VQAADTKEFYFIKIKNTKIDKLPTVMERDNASDCPRRAPRHYMHIRASIDVTLLQFSSSRSLSLYLRKENGKASCISGSTCLQTVPHRTKTNLQAILTTTRTTPLQFSK
jgi:hypothetical protein